MIISIPMSASALSMSQDICASQSVDKCTESADAVKVNDRTLLIGQLGTVSHSDHGSEQESLAGRWPIAVPPPVSWNPKVNDVVCFVNRATYLFSRRNWQPCEDAYTVVAIDGACCSLKKIQLWQCENSREVPQSETPAVVTAHGRFLMPVIGLTTNISKQGSLCLHMDQKSNLANGHESNINGVMAIHKFRKRFDLRNRLVQPNRTLPNVNACVSQVRDIVNWASHVQLKKQIQLPWRFHTVTGSVLPGIVSPYDISWKESADEYAIKKQLSATVGMTGTLLNRAIDQLSSDISTLTLADVQASDPWLFRDLQPEWPSQLVSGSSLSTVDVMIEKLQRFTPSKLKSSLTGVLQALKNVDGFTVKHCCHYPHHGDTTFFIDLNSGVLLVSRDGMSLRPVSHLPREECKCNQCFTDSFTYRAIVKARCLILSLVREQYDQQNGHRIGVPSIYRLDENVGFTTSSTVAFSECNLSPLPGYCRPYQHQFCDKTGAMDICFKILLRKSATHNGKSIYSSRNVSAVVGLEEDAYTGSELSISDIYNDCLLSLHAHFTQCGWMRVRHAEWAYNNENKTASITVDEPATGFGPVYKPGTAKFLRAAKAVCTVRLRVNTNLVNDWEIASQCRAAP